MSGSLLKADTFPVTMIRANDYAVKLADGEILVFEVGARLVFFLILKSH